MRISTKQAGMPVIGMVWGQFAAYHVDRCEAVAGRLAGRARVRAIEIATASSDYAWEPSGAVAGARKITLFPGRSYGSVPWLRRCRALLRELRQCDLVLMGLPYSTPEAIAASWLLPLWRVRVVMLTESKHDDRARSRWREWLKSGLLAPYRAAIVGGRRSAAYARQLGFRRRIVLPGYDGVGLDRVRAQGGPPAPGGVPFGQRPFIFVGRFVAKKNLFVLLEAYARYRRLTGSAARRLVLAGDGPQAARLAARARDLGICQHVEFAGFLPAPEVSRRLSGALALLLVSNEEQWGLVVNEALAFGLPAIVSRAVGACDALVHHGMNGYVVDQGSAEDIARAMAKLGADEAGWRAMVAQSHARAWMGDAARLADAVEVLLDPAAREAGARIGEFERQMSLADD